MAKVELNSSSILGQCVLDQHKVTFKWPLWPNSAKIWAYLILSNGRTCLLPPYKQNLFTLIFKYRFDTGPGEQKPLNSI